MLVTVVSLSSPVVDIPIGAVSPTSLTQVRSQSDAGCFATGRAGVHIGGAMVFYLIYTHTHIYIYMQGVSPQAVQEFILVVPW